MRHTTTLQKLVIIYTLGLMAIAYDNSTMTSPYNKLVHGDPIHAIHDANTAAWGDWFWVLLAAIPYLNLWLEQKSFNIAQLWMITMLTAYNYLYHDLNFVFYLVSAFWVMTLLVKVFSPWWQ